VWLALCALAVEPAYSQPADALKKAQASFDQAQIDYLQGKYDDAAREFQDAYNARAFPQFLYNVGASFHMKGKKTSDPEAYQKAVDAYRKYLAEDVQAADKEKVQKAITVLEAEITRLKAAGTGSPAGAGAGSGSDGAGSAATAPAAAPSQEVEQLGDVKVRGLFVIESDPAGATIYLDDKRKGAFATTPWSGSLEGDHKVIIEKRGFTVVEKTISADPTKLFVFSASMSQQSFLGWVEISANIPGADIFIDDKSVGAVGKTPLSQNIKPGKHTFWISADGYDEYKQEIDVIANEVTPIKATLRGAPVGKLNVTGTELSGATVVVDGQVLCQAPCLKSVPQGEHEVTVRRPDYKPYTQKLTIQAKAETQLRVTLQPSPSRVDAIVVGVVAVGFATAGGILGSMSNSTRDDLKKEIAAGTVPPDSNDPRFSHGKYLAIAADVSFVAAGVSALTALYFTFRDKGAPSTGTVDMRSLALRPEIGPGYAGLGLGVSW
jgi:hypothetical protein